MGAQICPNRDELGGTCCEDRGPNQVLPHRSRVVDGACHHSTSASESDNGRRLNEIVCSSPQFRSKLLALRGAFAPRSRPCFVCNWIQHIQPQYLVRIVTGAAAA